MNAPRIPLHSLLAVLFPLLLVSPAAQAYVGPGVGAGAMAVVFGILVSLVLAIVGLVWFPIKRLLGRKKDEAS